MTKNTYEAVLDSPKYATQRVNMQTRGNTKIPFSECTEFTLHVTQKSEFSSKKKLIDYSEYKLRKYIDSVSDPQQKLILNVMLQDYVTGNIAVAWRKGQPVYIKVSKE